MANALTVNPWLVRSKPRPEAKTRLFCFPYAGGGASIFRGWQDELPQTVEVCAVELPGRGKRLLETPFTELSSLVRAAADALLPYLDKPFAFFGHSMGAVIGFELARHLRDEEGKRPLHLFVAGRRAPQLAETEAPTYNLPDAEFIDELRRLQGTPEEVLEHPELMELMIPVLRADFELIQTYGYTDGAPLGCPITAFGGDEDEGATAADLEAWAEQTTAAFSLRVLPGNHFFLNTARPHLLETIARELSRHHGGLM
ncbi:MAG: thioesterase [Pyrinomonadaceae bacterium]|nr:thioesterase [Pyrinomonadaceae bacterium]